MPESTERTVIRETSENEKWEYYESSRRILGRSSLLATENKNAVFFMNLSPSGALWLEGLCGDKWPDRFGVSHLASTRDIAESIVTAFPDAHGASFDQRVTRVEGRLLGESPARIAYATDGDDAAAASEYLEELSVRVKSQMPIIEAEPASESPVIADAKESPHVDEEMKCEQKKENTRARIGNAGLTATVQVELAPIVRTTRVPMRRHYGPYDEQSDDERKWQDDALCAQVDPEAFFPEKGGSTRQPKKICKSCEVREECLEYALETSQRFGIWGGMSERERHKLEKQRTKTTEVA